MNNAYSRRILGIIAILVIFTMLVATPGEGQNMLNEVMQELPFFGRLWDVVSKYMDIKAIEAEEHVTRTIWEDLLRSLFVTLVAIPLEAFLGRRFGFRYKASDTYDTPLSFGNAMRSFLYRGIAVIAATGILLLFTRGGLMASIMPGVSEFWQLPVMCLIMLAVTYFFFCVINGSFKPKIVSIFLLNVVGDMLATVMLVLIICRILANGLNVQLMGGLVSILLAALGISLVLNATKGH